MSFEEYKNIKQRIEAGLNDHMELKDEVAIINKFF